MTSRNNQFGVTDGKLLVQSARESISQFLSSNKHETPSALLSDPRFNQEIGCFVTLKSSGGEDSLRGCIGFPEPVYKLSKALPLAAIYAATEDPRFPPVNLSELASLTIEVSVLTKPERIEVKNQRELPERIEIGKDGLIMNWSFGSGLLLPQVATEMHWSTVEFLENLGLKAGARAHQWLVPGTIVSKFQAMVFREVTPNGDVILSNEKTPE